MNLNRLACLAGFVGYGVLLVASVLLLSVPGERVPVFALMIFFGVLPALSSVRKHRSLAVVLVFLAATLLLLDFAAGKKFQEKRRSLMQSAPSTRP